MSERFKKEKDYYLDVETRLEWSLDNFGKLPWKQALKICEDLGQGWRLPNIKELLTLVDYEKVNPATKLPKIVSSSYWSSTAYAGYTDYAWDIDFGYGGDGWYSKSSSFYVRAVRKSVK